MISSEHSKTSRYILVVLLIYTGSLQNYNFAQDKQLLNKSEHLSSIHPEFKTSLLKSQAWKKALYAPVLLTAAGLYSMTDNDVLNRDEIYEERNEWLPTFRCHIDDYLQYAPIAIVYGLNAFGVKGRNNFSNRTAILLKTEALVGMLTFSLKELTAVPRPDTGEPNSFPSGHTAQAFAVATFMAKEYGDQNLWYSIGAYSIATSVGVLRVMNNRHWASDVLVGAAIGILSTNIVYLTHHYRNGKKAIISSRALIAPFYDGRTGMLNMTYRI